MIIVIFRPFPCDVYICVCAQILTIIVQYLFSEGSGSLYVSALSNDALLTDKTCQRTAPHRTPLAVINIINYSYESTCLIQRRRLSHPQFVYENGLLSVSSADIAQYHCWSGARKPPIHNQPVMDCALRYAFRFCWSVSLSITASPRWKL